MGSTKKPLSGVPSVVLTTCHSDSELSSTKFESDLTDTTGCMVGGGSRSQTAPAAASPSKPGAAGGEGNRLGHKDNLFLEEQRWRRSVSLTLPLKALRGALHQMEDWRPLSTSSLNQDAASSPSVGYQTWDLKYAPDTHVFRQILILSIIEVVCGVALLVSEATAFIHTNLNWVLAYRRIGCFTGAVVAAVGMMGVMVARERSSRLLTVFRGLALISLVLGLVLVYAALGGVDMNLSNGGIMPGVLGWADVTLNVIKLLLGGLIMTASFLAIFI